MKRVQQIAECATADDANKLAVDLSFAGCDVLRFDPRAEGGYLLVYVRPCAESSETVSTTSDTE